ncbi:hypothetical protein KIL84_021964 [Mauremys mutica]|uniref:Uncharacterized protein n=1 Tax=Mauremys mutica TaxID=74926 RepID=A0A9D3XGQ2_9SAUR|nr:hypothetical protein KIL84_021964 [Mauremys mutica]
MCSSRQAPGRRTGSTAGTRSNGARSPGGFWKRLGGKDTTWRKRESQPVDASNRLLTTKMGKAEISPPQQKGKKKSHLGDVCVEPQAQVLASTVCGCACLFCMT